MADGKLSLPHLLYAFAASKDGTRLELFRMFQKAHKSVTSTQNSSQPWLGLAGSLARALASAVLDLTLRTLARCSADCRIGYSGGGDTSTYRASSSSSSEEAISP